MDDVQWLRIPLSFLSSILNVIMRTDSGPSIKYTNPSVLNLNRSVRFWDVIWLVFFCFLFSILSVLPTDFADVQLLGDTCAVSPGAYGPLLYLKGVEGARGGGHWTRIGLSEGLNHDIGSNMHPEPSRVAQRMLSLPGHTLGVPNQSSSKSSSRTLRSVGRTPPWITRSRIPSGCLTKMHHDEFRLQSHNYIPG